MRELTFRVFLKRYVRELSFQNTNSINKLSVEAATDTPRLIELLFLYALFSDKINLLIHACCNTELSSYYRPLLKYSADEVISILSTKSDILAPEFHKVWTSYQSLKNRAKSDSDTKELIRTKVKRLQNETDITNHTIYSDLNLNSGNISAWLNHSNNRKVSLDTAKVVLRYLENAHAKL